MMQRRRREGQTMRRSLKGVVAAALLSPAAAGSAPAAKLDEGLVRNFIAQQGRAWNARDFAGFYATFSPGAVIVLVTTHQGKEVARRVRTLAEDRRQSEHFFATMHATIRETDRVKTIAIAPDGRHAHVRVKETARIARHGRVKVSHAVTEQQLELRHGRIVSLSLMEFDTQ